MTIYLFWYGKISDDLRKMTTTKRIKRFVETRTASFERHTDGYVVALYCLIKDDADYYNKIKDYYDNAKFMTDDYERIIANTMEEDDDDSCIIIEL